MIKRNPQHFGALSGLRVDLCPTASELERASGYFERALEINPNLESVEETIELIRYKLRARTESRTPGSQAGIGPPGGHRYSPPGR